MTAGAPRNGLQAAQSFEPVDSGEPDVEKNHFKIARRSTLQRLFGGADRFNLVAFVLRMDAERFANPGLVVNNQNMRLGSHREVSVPF